MIVNIFYANRVGARNGAQADLENLERLLRHSAGFETVYVYVDLTRGSILKIMEHVSNSPEIGMSNAFYQIMEKSTVSLSSFRSIKKKR